jgi:hypothetical protein
MQGREPRTHEWHKESVDALLPGNSISASATIIGNCVPKLTPDSPHLRIERLAMTDQDYVQSSLAAPVPMSPRPLQRADIALVFRRHRGA